MQYPRSCASPRAQARLSSRAIVFASSNSADMERMQPSSSVAILTATPHPVPSILILTDSILHFAINLCVVAEIRTPSELVSSMILCASRVESPGFAIHQDQMPATILAQKTFEGARSWIAADAPATSAMASACPSSWEWISSSLTP